MEFSRRVAGPQLHTESYMVWYHMPDSMYGVAEQPLRLRAVQIFFFRMLIACPSFKGLLVPDICSRLPLAFAKPSTPACTRTVLKC